MIKQVRSSERDVEICFDDLLIVLNDMVYTAIRWRTDYYRVYIVYTD